jgi:hypothetical protein
MYASKILIVLAISTSLNAAPVVCGSTDHLNPGSVCPEAKWDRPCVCGDVIQWQSVVGAEWYQVHRWTEGRESGIGCLSGLPTTPEWNPWDDLDQSDGFRCRPHVPWERYVYRIRAARQLPSGEDELSAELSSPVRWTAYPRFCTDSETGQSVACP